MYNTRSTRKTKRRRSIALPKVTFFRVRKGRGYDPYSDARSGQAPLFHWARAQDPAIDKGPIVCLVDVLAPSLN